MIRLSWHSGWSTVSPDSACSPITIKANRKYGYNYVRMGELIWGIVIVICRTIQSRNVLCKRLRDCACPWLKRLAASASIRDLRRAVIDVAVSLCLIQQHRKGLCRDCTEESSSSESAAVKIMSWVYTAQVTRIQHRLQDCMHEFIKNVCFFFFFLLLHNVMLCIRRV